MTGSLVHSPAQILRKLLIDLGLGSMPDPTTTIIWPIFAESMPSSPDNLICTYTTQGVLQGSSMVDGEVQESYGFMIKVSTAVDRDGWSMASLIVNKIDKEVNRTTVIIDAFSYLVHSMRRTSSILNLGKGVPANKQNAYTINGTMTITQIF